MCVKKKEREREKSIYILYSTLSRFFKICLKIADGQARSLSTIFKNYCSKPVGPPVVLGGVLGGPQKNDGRVGNPMDPF